MNNNWTEEHWQLCRRISVSLVKLDINLSPRIIMGWDESTLKICTDWIEEQWVRHPTVYLRADAGENPPDLLKPYVVPENMVNDFEYFCGFECFKDTIYKHHEGEYTEYSLDDRGNCVDVWIDGRRTGQLDLEGGGFNGGEVEREILLKEGYEITQVGDKTNG